MEQADAIVLLHGLGGSRISWEPQLADLAASHRVVAWDLPGYGDAPPLDVDGPPTFAALADAVPAFTDDVVGAATRAHLVGISFGGMIAQYAAAAHPRRFASLTLLSTSPKFGLDGTSPDAWRAARLAPLDAGQQPADFADTVLRAIAGPNISEDAFAGQRAAMARISAEGLRRSIECLVHHDSRALLPTIVTPTLLLVGELDEETPPTYTQAIADALPGAVVRVIAGAGHLLNAEAPDEVNRAIAAHVARHPIERSS